MKSRSTSKAGSSASPKVSKGKAQLKAFLKEKGLKATRQRETIAAEFLRAGEHVTAEDLYRRISKKHRDIGFTTVYRTLKLLSASGLATEQVFADNLTRYEPMSAEDHHDHLICMKCGAITEFEDPKLERLQAKIADAFGFHVVSHRMEFYGYCRRCGDGV
jgi:Fur family ferric uptake transcriptional regulator